MVSHGTSKFQTTSPSGSLTAVQKNCKPPWPVVAFHTRCQIVNSYTRKWQLEAHVSWSTVGSHAYAPLTQSNGWLYLSLLPMSAAPSISTPLKITTTNFRSIHKRIPVSIISRLSATTQGRKDIQRDIRHFSPLFPPSFFTSPHCAAVPYTTCLSWGCITT